MEQATIAALLERYWQAETTVEEERLLADYFRQPVIAPEWEPWRPVFAYFEAEAQLTPGADFESKLMERIRQGEETTPVHPGTPAVKRSVHLLFYKTRWWAAAAIVLLGSGIFLVTQLRRTTLPATAGSVRQSGPIAQSASGIPAIKDTYDDPQQALAAIQRALRTASAKMNHGRTITQRQMDHMNDSWQTFKRINHE
jgi:hypothetical protein